MNYIEAVDYIHSIESFGSKPGLKRINALLDLMGNPEKDLKIIHVAGTNGKGSTSAMLASMLQKCGYQVGLFISPYLESFTERIQVNSKPVNQATIVKLVSKIKPFVEQVAKTEAGHPTQFEVVTAMGFEYFKEVAVDIVVLEVGLGGRFDATNAIKPIISVITSIGLDHQAILGNTLEQIAMEKAGIIKQGVPVVTGVSDEKPLAVIKEIAKTNKSEIKVINQDFSYQRIIYSLEGQRFKYLSTRELEANIKFIGKHQVNNASVAIAVLEVLAELGYQIDEQKMLTGLAEASWPGRLEVMQTKPLLILDGAHNSQATKAIRQAIAELFNDKIILVLGILADKDYQGMVKDLATLAKRVIVTAPDYYRALDTKAILREALKYCEESQEVKGVSMAIDKALEDANKDDLILITGSLYTVGEARTHIIENII